MNLPNALTLLRIFFVPFLVATLVQDGFRSGIGPLDATKNFWALAIFLAAAATDLLDGYLARRWRQITTVGTLLDPIADKLLISAALISLVQIRVVAGWMVVVIVGREFAVSGLRSIAAAEGYTIKASDLGKTKMASQVAAICLLMLSQAYPVLAPAATWALWLVLLFGLASAVGYFMKFWRKVDDSIKSRSRSELLVLEREKTREAMLRPASSRATRSGPSPEQPASGQ
mgnify:CR=1 FL=1